MSAYMKIDGMKGNVTAKGLEGFIELSSTNFGVKRKMNTQPGSTSDREGTKPAVSEFVITKEVDSTSPYLFKDSAVGVTIPSVEIKFINSGKDLSEYHSVTLSNVIISGYELNHDENGVSKEDRAGLKPQEKIVFNFTKVEVKNTPHSKDHKAGSPTSAGYDLETAQAL